jgi:protein-S-isoprenylcysteine O-methyltransferase Ste14
MPQYTRRQRAIAVCYGIACHATFAVAMATMMRGLYDGLASGAGRFTGAAAVIANAALLVQFPVLHSVLLTAGGRRCLRRLAPAGLGHELVPTTYALVASLQILATFACWSPSGVVWWAPTGATLAASTVINALAWLLLLKAMADAGLAMQTGFAGWSAVVQRPASGTRRFPTHGLFSYVRQPVYVAFALTLWTGPRWTPDHLAVAIGWTLYCVTGPLLKEERYRRRYGAVFDAYQRSVPYWIPRLRAVPEVTTMTDGAA